MSTQGHRPWWLYSLAVAALAACLWVGWSDFTPWVPQAAVQEAIRAAPRRIFQILVQFVAQVLLVGFLVSECAAFVR
jgi:hypothetical protein